MGEFSRVSLAFSTKPAAFNRAVLQVNFIVQVWRLSLPLPLLLLLCANSKETALGSDGRGGRKKKGKVGFNIVQSNLEKLPVCVYHLVAFAFFLIRSPSPPLDVTFYKRAFVPFHGEQGTDRVNGGGVTGFWYAAKRF